MLPIYTYNNVQFAVAFRVPPACTIPKTMFPSRPSIDGEAIATRLEGKERKMRNMGKNGIARIERERRDKQAYVNTFRHSSSKSTHSRTVYKNININDKKYKGFSVMTTGRGAVRSERGD